MSTSKNNNTLIIAGAVVFAGLLIAAGVFFGNDSNLDNNTANSQDGVIAAAEAAGLDSEGFRGCINSSEFQSDVEEDVNNASEAGASGTPYNVLVMSNAISESARTDINNLINGLEISEDGKRLAIGGAMPYAAMTQLIDIILTDNDSASSDGENSNDIAVNPVDENDHIRGNIDAQIVLVEYSDFLCPFCGQFHNTMKELMDTYSDNELAWVYRQFPIPSLHPQAPRYSQASECIADIEGNEGFWEYADSVFETQG